MSKKISDKVSKTRRKVLAGGVAMLGEDRPAEKAQVKLRLDPSALHVYDKETGRRL